MEVANFCAAMDTLIDQDDPVQTCGRWDEAPLRQRLVSVSYTFKYAVHLNGEIICLDDKNRLYVYNIMTDAWTQLHMHFPSNFKALLCITI